MDDQQGWDTDVHVAALSDAGALLVAALGDTTGPTEGARLAATTMVDDPDVDWHAVAVATAGIAGSILRALSPSPEARERAIAVVPQLVEQQRNRWGGDSAS